MQFILVTFKNPILTIKHKALQKFNYNLIVGWSWAVFVLNLGIQKCINQKHATYFFLQQKYTHNKKCLWKTFLPPMATKSKMTLTLTHWPAEQ